MLPRAYRVWTASDWAAIKGGASSRRGSVVTRVVLCGDDKRLAALAVSKAVGGAVQRNRVKRRLRGILVGVLADLPPGIRLLVRALPPAAGAGYRSLERDIKDSIQSAFRKTES